jgi:membrane associated rhomboid family serine protease
VVIAFYLFARLMIGLFKLVIIGTAAVVVLVGAFFSVVFALLMDPDVWRPRDRRQARQAQVRDPRNARMYYSDRS